MVYCRIAFEIGSIAGGVFAVDSREASPARVRARGHGNRRFGWDRTGTDVGVHSKVIPWQHVIVQIHWPIQEYPTRWQVPSRLRLTQRAARPRLEGDGLNTERDVQVDLGRVKMSWSARMLASVPPAARPLEL